MTNGRIHDANDILRGWKAWYGDGKVFTSENFKWVDIPVSNFQYLKKFWDRNTDSFAGLDMYIISEDPDEIKKLIAEDSRNVKVGKAIPDFKKFQDPIELEKGKVMVMK